MWNNTLTYRRVGTATYEVLDGGDVVGTVWRTRAGWSGAKPTGMIVVEDYQGSRAVAAGNVRNATRIAAANKEPRP